MYLRVLQDKTQRTSRYLQEEFAWWQAEHRTIRGKVRRWVLRRVVRAAWQGSLLVSTLFLDCEHLSPVNQSSGLPLYLTQTVGERDPGYVEGSVVKNSLPVESHPVAPNRKAWRVRHQLGTMM